MLSPFYGRPAIAPPVNPSRSLEGLENSVPPTSPLSLAGRPYYLQPNKPLPEKPLPETPAIMGYYSTAWSNDTSTINSSSRCSSRESSRYSTDSYPIFVSSGSEDEVDQDHHPLPPSGSEGVGKVNDLASPGAIPAPLGAFLASDDDDDDESNNSDKSNDENEDDEPYGPAIRHTITDWTQNRYGPNHYFREKKWDFFPELATPSALPNGTWPSPRPASALQNHSKSFRKRNLSAFDLRKLNRNRGNSTTTGSVALANNVRNSIRNVVQRTLAKPTLLDKEKEKHRREPRPSTVQRTATGSTDRSGGACSSASKPPRSYEDVFSASERMRSFSISTRASTMGRSSSSSPRSAPPQRPKQLAMPLSPYQKYGAAIWEKPQNGSAAASSTTKLHQVQFPRYYQNNRRWSSSLLSSAASTTTSSSSSDQSTPLAKTQSNPVLPVSVSVSPPLRSQVQRSTREYARALQDGTSYMLEVLDIARRRVVDARTDRRRAQLKAQIRLVGPVNPYTVTVYNGGDPWM